MRRLVFLFVLVLIALVGGSAVAYAQAAPKPSLSRADLTAVVQSDKSAKVTAKYAINNAEGLKDLKVENQLADLPGLTIEGLKATAGNTSLQVSNETRPGFDQVTIQLPADAKGKVEYTLEYTARANRSDFRFPVLVPNFPVAASVPSFFATVTLPPNSNFQGDEFPRLVATEQQGGSTVLKMQEVNVPAHISANFGQGGAPLFTETNVSTIASLLFIGLTGMWWWGLKAGK
jgi:hypothetical protein